MRCLLFTICIIYLFLLRIIFVLWKGFHLNHTLFSNKNVFWRNDRIRFILRSKTRIYTDTDEYMNMNYDFAITFFNDIIQINKNQKNSYKNSWRIEINSSYTITVYRDKPQNIAHAQKPIYIFQFQNNNFISSPLLYMSSLKLKNLYIYIAYMCVP